MLQANKAALQMRREDDRPEKNHSDVAVLIVNGSGKAGIIGREGAQKIETFFKDLNSRNEVAIISLTSPQETLKFMRGRKSEKRQKLRFR